MAVFAGAGISWRLQPKDQAVKTPQSLPFDSASRTAMVSGVISDISLSLSSGSTSASSTMTIGFTATSALPASGGRINLQFNGLNGRNSSAYFSSNFDFNSATLNNATSPSGLSIYSKNWNGLTLSTSQAISAGSTISLVINNVTNPSNGGKYFAHLWTSNYYEDLDGTSNWGGDYNSGSVTVGSNLNVSGTITDAQSNPVPFATVSIYTPNWSSYYYAYTDRDGKYGLGDVTAGTYTFDLNYSSGNGTGKAYFPPAKSTLTVPSSGAVTKDVSFLANTKTLTVKIRKDSASGSPTTNATIYLYKSGGNGWASKDVNSNGDASFQLTGGTWGVSVGAKTWPADWALAWSNETIPFADDSATESKEKIIVVDSVNSTISGTFTYPSGQSLTNQWLTWLSFSNTKNQYFSAQFDSSGNFTARVSAGTYSASCGVSDQNYTCPPISNFTVGSNETKALGSMKLSEKPYSISGSITASGEAVVGASVSVWKSAVTSGGGGNYEWGSATSGSDGSYQVKVAGGTYSISAWPQWKEGGYDYVYSGKPENVTVNSGTVTKNFEFRKATNTLTVNITDEAGAVLSDFSTWVSAGDGSQDWGNIGSSIKGAGTLKVPAGTWDIRAYIYYNDYSSPDAQRVTFSGNNESQTITIKAVRNNATIRGTVYDENGSKVTNVWVSINGTRGKNGSWYNATFDSTTGEYTMKVAPGTIKIGYWVDSNLGYSSLAGQDSEVTVAAEGTATYNITLRKADSEIQVEATKPDGTAMPWAWVTADTRDPKEKRATDYYYSGGASTDNSGRATLKVPSGIYFVGGNMWYGSGYINPKREKATTSAGNPASVKLVFRPADATISGSVTKDGSGINAFITAWSEGGGYAETTANNEGAYILTVTKDDKWHIRGVYETTAKEVYKSRERIVELAETEKPGQDLELIKQSYVLPDSQTLTFDPSQQQSVNLEDGTIINIPARAMGSSGTVTLTVEPTANLAEEADAVPLSYGYDIQATNSAGEEVTQLASNMTIESKYDSELLDDSKVTNAQELVLGYYDTTADTWIDLPCTIDTDQKLISCQTDHLTTFAIVTASDRIAPFPPSTIRATAGDRKVTLEWVNTTDTDLAGVNIYRSTVEGYLGDKIKDRAAGTTYEDTGLTNGSRYYYIVRSVDQSGNESINSTQVNVAPQAPASATSASTSSSSSTTPTEQSKPAAKTKRAKPAETESQPETDVIHYLGDKLLPDELANLKIPGPGVSRMAVIIFILLAIVELIWKPRALYLAAKRDERDWFNALLILYSAGLLSLFYLYIYLDPRRYRQFRAIVARLVRPFRHGLIKVWGWLDALRCRLASIKPKW